LYDHLFKVPDPDEVPEGGSFLDHLNPESLQVISQAQLEPSLSAAKTGQRFQFERLGYFVIDPDSSPGSPIFNRAVSLRDTWAKVQKRTSIT
jgi:glutaminyl-tRNA synthetase